MKSSFIHTWPRILWILFVLALPAVIIYNYFPGLFKCPACYLFEDNGDGLKNYYTLAYYVQHDHGWHFSGMNYPYGENIIYTDNQPILALTLQWIDKHVIDMDRHVTGTLNMLLLVSLYLSVLLVYYFLRRWNVGPWWALASSLCIIFLSPQLWRFHGHYALAYLCFLPAFYLLLDLIVTSTLRRWLWTILCGLFIIVMSLTHMYFLLICSVVLLGFIFFWWLYHRKEKILVRQVMPYLLGLLILPGIFLIGVRHMTDPIHDRPVEPYGIDVHTINFESTFFPFFTPFDKVWTVILHREVPNFESLAYTGLIGLLMLPVICIFLFRKKDNDPLTLRVKTFIGTAIVCWIMAAGVLYQHGFKFLWDLVPVLKQFRGLGRMGLSFYYLYMIACSYILWQFYVRLRDREMGSIAGYILGAAFLVWGFEARLNSKAVIETVFRENKAITSSKDNYVPVLTAAGYKPEDFQAILQLPLVAIGNETVGVARGFWTLREGIHASIETGLPLIDYAMSRTSVSEGLDIIELISSPYYEKRRASHFDSRPILLLCEEEFVIPAERKWIEQAKKIGQYESMTLYDLPSDVFRTVRLPVMQDGNNTHCDGWFEGFENIPCDTAMTGNGAAPVKSVPYSIWQYTDTSSTERQWEVSFWSHVDHLKGNVPVPRMMETDSAGTITQNTGLGREVINWSEAYGSWIRVGFPWTTKGHGYRYELFIDNTGPVIDNLLIRPAGDTCILHFPEMILYNNLPIPVLLPKSN